MPEVSEHHPGAPAWVELATTNEAAALSFYSALFGWADNPQPMGPDSYYHMQQLRGLDVAGIYQLSEEQTQQGVPPHWGTYFSVDNADETTNKVKQAGGQVLLEPMDVFDAGRMAAFQDPQGAVFSAWQPRNHIGYRVMQDPGTVAWNELMTPSSEAAAVFYRSTLGVQTEKADGPIDYTLMKLAGQERAGILEITPDMGAVPPNWMVYFGVSDVDATVSQAQSMEATVLVPPMDIPVGRFAVLHDPQGAVFGVLKFNMDG